MAIETLSVGNNSNVIYVAPSNSTNKEIADYVCDGTNDSNQINAAIQAAGTGKEIVLLDGKFNINEKLNVDKEGLTIRGIKDKTVVEQVSLKTSGNDATSAIIFDITAGFVTLKDMMVVDVDVDLPQYVIRARKGVESCVFEGLFFILKATKTDLGYISLETEGARIINCRVYNYGTVNQKKTISINGNETIIWGLWNTGNDRTRVNYEGNFTHYEFGNNKYDIYVNGIKQ